MKFLIIISLSILLSTNLMAASSDATITRMYGKVQLLLNPSKTKKGPSPHALYKGKYYNVKKAKKGMKFPTGSVIKTGKSSKAKIIYPNGDQVSIGSETFLKISYGKSISKKILDLFSGSIRAIVEKKGHNRQRVEVRTKSMVMGVRGTDFYVDAHNENGDSTISVIRGYVEVTPKVIAKKLDLKSGYTMDIDEKQSKPVIITRNTKTGLKKIYKATLIKKSAKEKDSKEVAELERKAVEVTKLDIKLYDPELYEKIEKMPADKVSHSSELASIVIDEAIKQAPEKDLKPKIIEPKSKESIYNK